MIRQLAIKIEIRQQREFIRAQSAFDIGRIAPIVDFKKVAEAIAVGIHFGRVCAGLTRIDEGLGWIFHPVVETIAISVRFLRICPGIGRIDVSACIGFNAIQKTVHVKVVVVRLEASVKFLKIRQAIHVRVTVRAVVRIDRAVVTRGKAKGHFPRVQQAVVVCICGCRCDVARSGGAR